GDDEHEEGPAVLERQVDGPFEKGRLAVASDEREIATSMALSGRGDRGEGAPDLDGMFPSAQIPDPEVLVGDGLGSRRVGRLAHDDLTGAGQVLESSRGVHDVTHGGDRP